MIQTFDILANLGSKLYWLWENEVQALAWNSLKASHWALSLMAYSENQFYKRTDPGNIKNIVHSSYSDMPFMVPIP